MQRDMYQQGYSDGFESSRNPMGAFELSQKYDEYRVGYVMGVCSTINAPREFWAPLAGEQAAELHVPLMLFKSHIDDDIWHLFVEGYTGEEAELDDGDDDED
ncbi:hypothetical protein [Stutzerimonas balearica]|uniref:hypothetical protein n=1 Tax=Stutzerimonas balearica TaxID=74829 RepID=UPI00190A609F|nr:hypothetical protein [Stutzerimonas balearica]MBK3748280.1 hypothetical protein [Stutzerimonas balearica]MBK3826477.1 hypothetical protein [Stutzerimonas balearica]MBK3856167.1 hypothetical protein [Stutzerimonas balearica]